VAADAHQVWAKWAAAALGGQFRPALEQDPALTAHVPLRNWAETIVKHVRPTLRFHDTVKNYLLRGCDRFLASPQLRREMSC